MGKTKMGKTKMEQKGVTGAKARGTEPGALLAEKFYREFQRHVGGGRVVVVANPTSIQADAISVAACRLDIYPKINCARCYYTKPQLTYAEAVRYGDGSATKEHDYWSRCVIASSSRSKGPPKETFRNLPYLIILTSQIEFPLARCPSLVTLTRRWLQPVLFMTASGNTLPNSR